MSDSSFAFFSINVQFLVLFVAFFLKGFDLYIEIILILNIGNTRSELYLGVAFYKSMIITML